LRFSLGKWLGSGAHVSIGAQQSAYAREAGGNSFLAVRIQVVMVHEPILRSQR